MKRVIYLFACIFIFTIKSGAYDVTLNDQNTKVIVKTLDCCRIIVERGPSNAGNNPTAENTENRPPIFGLCSNTFIFNEVAIFLKSLSSENSVIAIARFS